MFSCVVFVFWLPVALLVTGQMAVVSAGKLTSTELNGIELELLIFINLLTSF